MHLLLGRRPPQCARPTTPRAQASLSKPAELNPPAAKQEEFAKKFGITWKAALEKGIVYNAVDGCKRLGIDGGKMEETWVRPMQESRTGFEFFSSDSPYAMP